MAAIETFVQDLKHSFRMFVRSPAFTVAAIAALTLGIGVNTAIFSVVNVVLLRPMGVPDPDRLVVFMNVAQGGQTPSASPAKFQHYRRQTGVVQDVAAFKTGVVNYTGGSFPEQLASGRASADLFRLFGAAPILGRTFTPEEDRPGGGRVAILSESFWASRFGSDPGVIGRAISLSGEPYTVIGVLGPFHYFENVGVNTQVWTPFQFDPNTTDQGNYFLCAGRLKPGVSLASAQAQLRLSADEYRRLYPDAIGPNDAFSVVPIREVLVRAVRSTLFVLTGAVSFVLLIACANVANLLLARATGRRREIAIRSAIGASRGRIIRQLLTESVVLSLAGGVLGLVLGVLGIRALLAVNTLALPLVGQNGASLGVDWRVAVFTLAVSLGTGLLFGLIPALQGSRADLTTALKESAGRSGTGFRQNKARSLLVVTEVALALVLLVLDGFGWRFVAVIFDRERLVTGTRS